MDKDYYLILNNKKIPVSKEIYYTYKRAIWREQKRCKTQTTKELPLEDFLCNNSITNTIPIHEIVERNFLTEKLLALIKDLPPYDRHIIYSLFYLEKTERQLSDEIRVPQTTINYHKRKILNDLREKLE